MHKIMLQYRREQPRGVNIKQFWEVYNRARAGLGVLRARLGQTSINAQSKLGRTPINHAAVKGEHAVVTVTTLARLGADMWIPDTGGHTPLTKMQHDWDLWRW